MLTAVLVILLLLSIGYGRRWVAAAHERQELVQELIRRNENLLQATQMYHDLHRPLIKISEILLEMGKDDSELARLVIGVLERHKAAGQMAIR